MWLCCERNDTFLCDRWEPRHFRRGACGRGRGAATVQGFLVGFLAVAITALVMIKVRLVIDPRRQTIAITPPFRPLLFFCLGFFLG